MVFVFREELLGWDPITPHLREIIKAKLPRTSTSTASVAGTSTSTAYVVKKEPKEKKEAAAPAELAKAAAAAAKAAEAKAAAAKEATAAAAAAAVAAAAAAAEAKEAAAAAPVKEAAVPKEAEEKKEAAAPVELAKAAAAPAAEARAAAAAAKAAAAKEAAAAAAPAPAAAAAVKEVAAAAPEAAAAAKEAAAAAPRPAPAPLPPKEAAAAAPQPAPAQRLPTRKEAAAPAPAPAAAAAVKEVTAAAASAAAPEAAAAAPRPAPAPLPTPPKEAAAAAPQLAPARWLPRRKEAAAPAPRPAPAPRLLHSEIESEVSIQDRLKQARQDDVACPWDWLSIYRVPHYLKHGEEKAYDPQIVSLGPYHHGKQNLRPMDCHKERSLHQVLKQTGHNITLYLDSIKELENRARACYEGQILLRSKEFIEMMVLDGCFVLELFCGVVVGFEKLGYQSNDPVFSKRGGSMHSIQRDMIMLENQIPMFILDRLLGIQLGNPDQKGLVAKLALAFFRPLMPTDRWLNPSSDYQSGLHCLEVLRRSLLSSPDSRNSTKRCPNTHPVAERRQQLKRCVMELREAGIEIKKGKTDQFWDIKFENGVLYIPRIVIHDGTRSLFLNLIAFEQYHIDCSDEVISYVVFMDNLINSPEDVAHLHHSGIVEHWLRSHAEVADLFNRLTWEVAFDKEKDSLSTLSEEVNQYCQRRCNVWRASLMHNYFSSPWAIVSVIAAAFLLLLTCAQTFYAAYGYHRPAGS